MKFSNNINVISYNSIISELKTSQNLYVDVLISSNLLNKTIR